MGSSGFGSGITYNQYVPNVSKRVKSILLFDAPV